jgi:hypothetical protein
LPVPGGDECVDRETNVDYKVARKALHDLEPQDGQPREVDHKRNVDQHRPDPHSERYVRRLRLEVGREDGNGHRERGRDTGDGGVLELYPDASPIVHDLDDKDCQDDDGEE